MAETWYLRDTAHTGCGFGVLHTQSQTAGASVATRAITGTIDGWRRVESARSIAAGDWEVLFDLTVAAGGGPANKVRVDVAKRDAACGNHVTLFTIDLVVTKDTTQEYTTGPQNLAQQDFADGDFLWVRLLDVAGNQAKTLRYNGAAGSDADTRLVHPNVSAAPQDVAGTDTLTATEQRALAGTATRTEGAALIETLAGEAQTTRAEALTVATADILAGLLGRADTLVMAESAQASQETTAAGAEDLALGEASILDVALPTDDSLTWDDLVEVAAGLATVDAGTLVETATAQGPAPAVVQRGGSTRIVIRWG